MKHFNTMTTLITLIALTGCGSDKAAEPVPAILLKLKGEAADIQSATSRLRVVLDHEEPYAEDTKISESMALKDVDGDGIKELIINVDPASEGAGKLPSVELRPGANTSAFTVSLMGLVSGADLGTLAEGDKVVTSEGSTAQL